MVFLFFFFFQPCHRCRIRTCEICMVFSQFFFRIRCLQMFTMRELHNILNYVRVKRREVEYLGFTNEFGYSVCICVSLKNTNFGKRRIFDSSFTAKNAFWLGSSTIWHLHAPELIEEWVNEWATFRIVSYRIAYMLIVVESEHLLLGFCAAMHACLVAANQQ